MTRPTPARDTLRAALDAAGHNEPDLDPATPYGALSAVIAVADELRRRGWTVLPPGALPEPARSRTTDPSTSHRAGASVTVTARSAAARILREHDRVSRNPACTSLWAGLTDEEAGLLAGVRAAHKRVSELLRAGLLEPVVLDGEPLERRSTVTGRDGRVLTITPAGRALLGAFPPVVEDGDQ